MAKSKQTFFFALPAFVFFAVFFCYPVLYVFINSFREENLITAGSFIGFENYTVLLTDIVFWKVLLNSFLYILVTPILIAASLMLALALRGNNRLNRIFRSAFFFPVVTPLVTAGIIWKWMFAEDMGIINYLFSSLGISSVKWLSAFPENMLAVMIITIWRGAGYYMMIMLAGLAVTDADIEEAAILDGAGYWQRVWHIIIPQLRSTIVMVFVISSIAAVKLFTELYVLIPGAPMAQKTIVSLLFRESFEKFNMGYGSAIGILLFLFTLGLSIANLKLLDRPDKP
ncbi:MAG: sugar ABC transporter permease [Ignavibacteriales bacterium]|nr:sugar ABC transporter permease [Ignavibacteriales bacterium]